MHKEFESLYHKVELSHWWFNGRRQAVRRLVLASAPQRQGRILEIGCSGGPLMLELRRDGFTDIEGIDCSAEAIESCQKQGLHVQVMDAQALSFPDASMDIITASDILEHLPDERTALREWRRVLKPGGFLIVFVPAFMFLWTEHDVANKHYRRYQRGALVQKLQEAGFTVERSSYWNAFLFPPVAVIRTLKRLLTQGAPANGEKHGDLSSPPGPLNALLLAILRCENWFFQMGANWPFGVSAMALARRPLS